jgi:HB1/ASXL restriction endonuclease-like protein with HTH domain
MDFLEAALVVLREEGAPLHWTVIQDRALRAGLLDPFTQPDIRRSLLSALAEGVRGGAVAKAGTGVYALVEGSATRPTDADAERGSED